MGDFSGRFACQSTYCSYNNHLILLHQIDRQLSAYMRRVEDVLGKGWENHVEGQRLKADGDSFRQKLNTQELFDDWSRKVSTLNQVKLGLTPF